MDFPEYFSIPFIQAINDWIICPTEENVRKLADLSKPLPDAFKERTSHVYRRIDLDKSFIWDLLADEMLVEKISSWSENVDVARSHGGNPQEYQAALFSIPPDRGTTIVNISRLFGPGGFRLACLMQQEAIIDYEYGIEAFDNCEEEVVVSVAHLRPDDLIGFLGSSSSEVELIYMAGKARYGRLANADEQAALLGYLRWGGRKLGLQWLSEDGVLNVRRRMTERIAALKRRKLLQDQLSMPNNH